MSFAKGQQSVKLQLTILSVALAAPMGHVESTWTGQLAEQVASRWPRNASSSWRPRQPRKAQV